MHNCNEMTPQQGGLSHGATVGTTSKDPHDWALFFRFLAISTVSTIASIGNIFTISAIIIDDLLRKKGNSFLVSMTLADLLTTTIVLPATSVAILSQMEASENLCRFQYAMAAMSCVTAAIFTAFIGIENFLRLRTLRQVEKHRRRRQQQQQQQQQRHPPPAVAHHSHSTSGTVTTSLTTTASGSAAPRSITVHMLPPPLPEPRKPYKCSQFQVTVLNLSIWVISGFLVLFHVWNMPQLMYTSCGFFEEKGLNRESLIHALLTFAICFTAFIFVGGLGFLKCVCIMKSWDRPKPYLISREFALISSNCWNWLARFLIWCPSLLIAIVTHSQQSLIPTAVSGGGGNHGIFGDPAATASSSSSESTLHHLTSSSSSSAGGGMSNFASIISTTVSPLVLFGHNGISNPSNILGGVVAGGDAGSNSRNSSMSASELISLQRMLLWPAILPPCLSSLINAMSNRDFRRCYIQLFHYCCCKTSVALTRRSRDNLRGGSDVRVHIIPGYNIYNSSTGGHFSEVTQTPPRFNTFKCGSLIACRRDVYEL